MGVLDLHFLSCLFCDWLLLYWFISGLFTLGGLVGFWLDLPYWGALLLSVFVGCMIRDFWMVLRDCF